MKNQIYTAIKITSIGLISAALAFELGNLALGISANVPPLIVGFERFALIAHALEAAIAAVFAPSHQQRSLPYGLYTFFVGTVGLMELFDIDLLGFRTNTPGHN